MSGVVIALEVVGIAGAAIGMALAQNPPQDLAGWWGRQSWVRWLMAADDGDEPDRGLAILPWAPDDAPPEPADGRA